MSDGAAAEGRGFEPWRLRSDRLDVRRRELFALAAPVFRRHGYAGATIKQLAHACHLSPPGLYHYFASKRELATYLLRTPRLDWDSTWVDGDLEPLAQIALLIDLAIVELPNYLLAFQLGDEIAGTRSDGRERARGFREGEAVFGRLIAAAAPGVDRERAAGIARDILATLAGTAVTGLDPDPESALRRRIIVHLRRELVPTFVEADHFDRLLETE